MSYAIVGWSVDDVLSLRPKWSDDRADEFLRKYQRQIADLMIERGWDAIEALLSQEEACQADSL